MEDCLKVKLNEYQKIQDFLSYTATLEANIVAYNEHFIVDAKSILGLMSLDLSNPICLLYKGDNKSEEYENFVAEIEKFRV